MGVHGLWKLIESSGKPIPIETLENKVLAVDISIWLHQAVKGFQDHKGAPVANAHLLGIYHRVCKLLYFKIKPIFVFDGGVPALKRQTIAKRNQLKSRNASEADRIQNQLLSTLLKHTAISKVLSEKTKASLPLPKKSSGKYDNLYSLPASSEFDSTLSSSDDDDNEETDGTTTSDSSPTKQFDLHTIDTTSIYFKSLPLDVKHEILTDLKETRKQNTWAKLHLFPKQSDDFSIYQMKRLLKRQEVQSALEDVSKEMGGMSLSLAELESLLKDKGIKTTNDSNIGKRIASDENTRYLYIKNIQEELKKAEQKEQAKNISEKGDDEEDLERAIQLSLQETPSTSEETGTKKKTKADLEEEEELQKAIQLSLEETPSTSSDAKMSTFSILEDFQSDSEEDFVEKNNKPALKKLSSAESYMLEYSGLTRTEIDKIINKNASRDSKFINSNKLTKKSREVNHIAAEEVSRKIKMKSITEEKEFNVEESINPFDTKKERINRKLETVIEEKAEDLKSISDVEIMSGNGNSDNAEADIAMTVVSLSEEKKDTSDIGFISDSEDSIVNDIDLQEDKPKLEIIIDPNKIEDDDDDLFSDIFDKETACIEAKTTKEQELVKYSKDIQEVSRDNTNKGHFDIFTKEKVHIENKVDKMDTSDSDQIVKPLENISTEKPQNGTVTEVVEENVVISQENPKMQPVISKMSVEEMEELKDNLQSEKIDLIRERANKERLAQNITDQMYQEAQDLLELFGVPYVIAPMEAEAQCAFLDEIELTNGTITDDSDIWLFGGRTVYKNFFNQSKYVMEFKSENIEHHFKLTREQMILLALLVGSDYTTGLQGVGPVTALEILASFPHSQSKEFKLSHNQVISGLREFKSWFQKGKAPGPGRSSLKNKLKNVTFSEGFPSSQVVEAYLEPKVETSADKFSWAKPDITGLKVFAKEKFGWTMKKSEEILNPVIKKLEENQAQKSIKDYFKTKFKVNPVDLEGKVSKRVKTALDKIGKTPDELIAEEMAELEKEKERAIRKTKAGRSEQSKSTKTRKKKVDNVNKDPGSNNSLEQNDNLKEVTSDEISKNKRTKTTRKTTEKTKDFEENESSKQKKDTNEETVGETQPPKRPRKKKETDETTKMLAEMEELKDYENMAAELKTRRKRRNELMKIKIDESVKKKPKVPPVPVDNIPKGLEDDDEIKLLEATTSQSMKRIEEIRNEALNRLENVPAKKKAPIPISSLHTKEVIHQKLRDKSNVLRSKLKAIEVYRKSKKGPGFVPKRVKKALVPKEDAGLSEDDSD